MSDSSSSTHNKGLTGWFSLIIVYLVANIVIGIFGVTLFLQDAANSDVYVYFISAFLFISLIIYSSIVLYFIFRRKRVFIKLLHAQNILNTLFVIVSFTYQHLWGFAPAYVFLFVFVLEVLLISLYLMKSQRVKNTFH